MNFHFDRSWEQRESSGYSNWSWSVAKEELSSWGDGSKSTWEFWNIYSSSWKSWCFNFFLLYFWYTYKQIERLRKEGSKLLEQEQERLKEEIKEGQTRLEQQEKTENSNSVSETPKLKVNITGKGRNTWKNVFFILNTYV